MIGIETGVFGLYSDVRVYTIRSKPKITSAFKFPLKNGISFETF